MRVGEWMRGRANAGVRVNAGKGVNACGQVDEVGMSEGNMAGD